MTSKPFGPFTPALLFVWLTCHPAQAEWILFNEQYQKTIVENVIYINLLKNGLFVRYTTEGKERFVPKIRKVENKTRGSDIQWTLTTTQGEQLEVQAILQAAFRNNLIHAKVVINSETREISDVLVCKSDLFVDPTQIPTITLIPTSTETPTLSPTITETPTLTYPPTITPTRTETPTPEPLFVHHGSRYSAELEETLRSNTTYQEFDRLFNTESKLTDVQKDEEFTLKYKTTLIRWTGTIIDIAETFVSAIFDINDIKIRIDQDGDGIDDVSLICLPEQYPILRNLNKGDQITYEGFLESRFRNVLFNYVVIEGRIIACKNREIPLGVQYTQIPFKDFNDLIVLGWKRNRDQTKTLFRSEFLGKKVHWFGRLLQTQVCDDHPTCFVCKFDNFVNSFTYDVELHINGINEEQFHRLLSIPVSIGDVLEYEGVLVESGSDFSYTQLVNGSLIRKVQ